MSFSLRTTSIASTVRHPYQIIVLYMLTTLFRCIKARFQSLVYEDKDTACMVNMAAVSDIFPYRNLDASLSSFY